MTNDLTELFNAHVQELTRMMEAGDGFATKTIAAMALLMEGWRPGDPDPSDEGPDGGGGEKVVDLSAWIARLAA
jgi:hypothetical protein